MKLINYLDKKKEFMKIKKLGFMDLVAKTSYSMDYWPVLFKRMLNVFSLKMASVKI